MGSGRSDGGTSQDFQAGEPAAVAGVLHADDVALAPPQFDNPLGCCSLKMARRRTSAGC